MKPAHTASGVLDQMGDKHTGAASKQVDWLYFGYVLLEDGTWAFLSFSASSEFQTSRTEFCK